MLKDLGCDGIPRIDVLNKCDLLPKGTALPADGVAISAVERSGFPTLLERAERILWREGHSDALVTNASLSTDDAPDDETDSVPGDATCDFDVSDTPDDLNAPRVPDALDG